MPFLLVSWLLAFLFFRPTTVPTTPAPPAVYAAAVKAPLVALTFDDGPDPVYTPRLLAILRRHQAVATFFVLGKAAEAYPNLVRGEGAAGMEVENHSFSHGRLPSLSPGRMAEEIAKGHGVIARLTKRAPRFLRPPYGLHSQTVREIAWRSGERLVLWSIDTRDWQGRSHQAMVEQVLRQLRPGDVVLFHDGGGRREETLQAVDQLLTDFQARGLRPVTLEVLLASADHLYDRWPERTVGQRRGGAHEPRMRPFSSDGSERRLPSRINSRACPMASQTFQLSTPTTRPSSR